MKLGKAVIANYSGNRNFTDRENACLVDYSLRKVKKEDCYLFGNAVWADADVEQAAGYLRRLFENEVHRNGIRNKVYISINENHGYQIVGKLYWSRLTLMALLSNDEMDDLSCLLFP